MEEENVSPQALLEEPLQAEPTDGESVHADESEPADVLHEKVTSVPVKVAEKPTVSEPADDLAAADEKVQYYRDALARLKDAPEDAATREKREKRERSKRLIGAISDGFNAMSNLFFTTQYAPNMYNHREGSALSAVERQIERARKERQANEEAFYNYSLGLANAKGERAKTVRELEAEAEGRKVAREKADLDSKLALERMGLLKEQKRKERALAMKAEVDAGRRGDVIDSEINRNNNVGKGKTGGGKQQYYGSLRDKDGNMVAYRTKADYEAALNEPWRNLSQYLEDVVKTETSDGEKTEKTTRTKDVKRSIADMAGENNSRFDKDKYKRGGATKPPLN